MTQQQLPSFPSAKANAIKPSTALTGFATRISFNDVQFIVMGVNESTLIEQLNKSFPDMHLVNGKVASVALFPTDNVEFETVAVEPPAPAPAPAPDDEEL